MKPFFFFTFIKLYKTNRNTCTLSKESQIIHLSLASQVGIRLSQALVQLGHLNCFYKRVLEKIHY